MGGGGWGVWGGVGEIQVLGRCECGLQAQVQLKSIQGRGLQGPGREGWGRRRGRVTLANLSGQAWEDRKSRLEGPVILVAPNSSPGKPGATLDRHWRGAVSLQLRLSYSSQVCNPQTSSHPPRPIQWFRFWRICPALVAEAVCSCLGRMGWQMQGEGLRGGPSLLMCWKKEPDAGGWSSTSFLPCGKGQFHPWPKIRSIPGQPRVRAAAYNSWAQREARGLDGDLWGGVHRLGRGGRSGGSSGLRDNGRRGLQQRLGLEQRLGLGCWPGLAGRGGLCRRRDSLDGRREGGVQHGGCYGARQRQGCSNAQPRPPERLQSQGIWHRQERGLGQRGRGDRQL